MEKTIEEVLSALETNQVEEIDYDVLNAKDFDPEEHWPRYFKQRQQSSNILILKPNSSNDVSTILKLANKLRIQISVLGGHSNVVGSFEGGPSVYLSTENLNTIQPVERLTNQITVGAGVYGGELLKTMEQWGFELGQYPQSLFISTVGGWINTRATGSSSTYYGGIEHAVIGLEAVLASGEVVTATPSARTPGGLDLIKLLIGSEGSFAVITSVTLEVHRKLPTSFTSVAFNDYEEAIDAQRQLVQGGFPIGLLRAYNIAETNHITESISKGVPIGDFALLTFSLIAPEESLSALTIEARKKVINVGGAILSDDVSDTWFINRYQCETMMRDRNITNGKMFDTVEVTLPWNHASDCALALEDVFNDKVERFYTHFSHAYQTGACMYALFFIEESNDAKTMDTWRYCQDRMATIVKEHNGTLAHHHGVGSERSEHYMQTDVGFIHKQIKEKLDPNNVLFCRMLLG
ncbi:FAD-binding oxidoreductase [Vibrio penaeicida]|uniref:FAD-binding oxidoreductase n=1 Tax=Vibrio penaeicida TaxID=104609 RepID=UPI000CE9CBB9|nr:FAD-binding oxidoreductase [Vibrio penaeicida]